jgi:hypothetical protein
MVSVKLLSPSAVEITTKRNGKVVGILHLTVVPNGKSIHVFFENKEAIQHRVTKCRNNLNSVPVRAKAWQSLTGGFFYAVVGEMLRQDVRSDDSGKVAGGNYCRVFGNVTAGHAQSAQNRQ